MHPKRQNAPHLTPGCICIKIRVIFQSPLKSRISEGLSLFIATHLLNCHRQVFYNNASSSNV